MGSEEEYGRREEGLSLRWPVVATSLSPPPFTALWETWLSVRLLVEAQKPSTFSDIGLQLKEALHPLSSDVHWPCVQKVLCLKAILFSFCCQLDTSEGKTSTEELQR